MGIWYHLNSGPREEWEEDIHNIRALGYDYIVVCWGKNAVLLREKVEDTLEMMAICDRCGLGVYLCVWSGNMMYPYLGEDNHQMDDKGCIRNFYNLWNHEWRNGVYKEYLQDVARSYCHCPALKGYHFDDTFASYDVKQRTGGRYTSYHRQDVERFQCWLKERYPDVFTLNRFLSSEHYYGIDHPQYQSWNEIEPPTDPESHLWLEWYLARSHWYEDWARETSEFIREIDPLHELYVEDGGRIAGIRRELRGIDLARIAKHFDVVALYEMPFGFEQPEVDMDPIHSVIDYVVSSTRRLAPGKQIGTCYHVYPPLGKDISWPYPDMAQIESMTEQAIKSGADKVEQYAYRTIDWRLKDVPAYPVMPDIKTMLRYRKDLWEGITELNQRVTSA